MRGGSQFGYTAALVNSGLNIGFRGHDNNLSIFLSSAGQHVVSGNTYSGFAAGPSVSGLAPGVEVRMFRGGEGIWIMTGSDYATPATLKLGTVSAVPATINDTAISIEAVASQVEDLVHISSNGSGTPGDLFSIGATGEVAISGTVSAANLLVNRKIIRAASDFGTIDSSVEYFIDGIVDMGSTPISVPAGGMTIKGYNFDQSQLVSSEDAYVMFSSAAAGNVLFTDVAFETSGSGSSLFALTSNSGFDAIEMNRVNFINCSSLGYLDNYRQGLESGTGRFGGSPQLEFRNTWVGGYRVTTSIVRGIGNLPSALFSAGSGFIYNGRFITDINCDLPATGALIDFSASNVTNNESLLINGAYITRSGTADSADTTIIPNISASSVKCVWVDNTGLPDTTKFISTGVTSESSTSISVGVPAPLAGTFTVNEESHFDSPANGEVRLIAGNGAYLVTGEVVLDSSPNRELELTVTMSTDDGLTWPTIVGTVSRPVNNLQGGRDVAFMPLNFIKSIKPGNRLRLEVTNNTDSNNVTAEIGSTLVVTKV